MTNFKVRAKGGCAVKSYKPTVTSSRHRFPNPDKFPQLFRTWVRLTGNKHTLKQLGLRYFKPRDFQQEPLENFFGRIRRFVNPTCLSFAPIYKSILVNNFLASHSIGANCEDDGGSLLYTIQHYFEENCCPEIILEVNVNVNEHIPQHTLSRFHKGALGYVAGYLIKMKSEISNCCKACRHNLLTRDSEDMESDYNTFSRSLEYGGKKKFRLQYCNRHLEQINWNFNPCEHSENVKKSIVKHFVFLNVHTFCKGINRVINGQDTRQIRSNHLGILKQAHEIYRIQRLWRKQ